MALNWAYAGYTFAAADQPTRGGAGEWNNERKVVIHTPINSNTDVITDFGRTSSRRTIKGRCGQGFRNQMRTFYNNQTIGNLVDGDGESQSAQILEITFDEVIPGVRWEYTITLIAR